MADSYIRAAFYLSPTVAGLWRWSEDGQVLTWPDNSTIAFRAEVDAVLRRLAPGGLPPFGAMVLVLAACREGWTQSAGRALIIDRERFCANRSITEDDTPTRDVQMLYAHIAREIRLLIDGLDALNRLPREHLEGMGAKALLSEVIFEANPNRCPSPDAAETIRAIDDGINPETLKPRASSGESLQQFAHQVDGLGEGLRRVDAETLCRRAKTGLDRPIHPAPDLAPPDAVRRLLAELQADRDLAGLARLAHDLMAAVSVPRTLRARDDLSVGGVSDLSNRGPLDRLLVSELAHDDLTLAVRVAVNEALYLRRESPPREPPHRRAILIDAGLRMWGIPRVFATAVALALAATNDAAAQLTVYRATRTGIEPVDLTTRAGLDSHLGELDTAAHPGHAIVPFFAAIANTGAAQTDAVLITQKDVLSDPDFIAAMSAAENPPMYVAAVDRGGSFSLLAFSKAGRKPIREARLSLDSILGHPTPGAKPTRVGVPLINPQVDLSLPAILFSEVFPFYLPHVVDPRMTMVSKKHGLISATQDGRLLEWRDGLKGARQLTSLLPRGFVRGVFLNEPMETVSVVITTKADRIAHLVTADLNDVKETDFVVSALSSNPAQREKLSRHVSVNALRATRVSITELLLSDPDPTGVFIRGDVVYLVYGGRVDAFSSTGGANTGTLALSKETRWEGNRFFRSGNNYFTIALGGSTGLTLERVPIRTEPLALFDRDGFDGTWSVNRFAVMDSVGKVHLSIPSTIRKLLGISRDGHRIAYETAGGRFIRDLNENGLPSNVTGNFAEELLAPRIYWSTRAPIQPRIKFRGIDVDGQSRLLLYTKHNDVFTISLDNSGGLILMEIGRGNDPTARRHDFNETRRSLGARVKMSVAIFNDGSKAWLDARGILHLKSSERTIPELSITLSNIQCAAWSSEGKITGPSRYVGDAARTAAPYFDEVLRRFTARLR